MTTQTRLGHIADVPVSSGTGVANPIKPHLFAGKHEAQLGRAVGLTQFGVNRLTLDPGAQSSLRHWHECEDEFVYVLSGALVLIDDGGEHTLVEGSFAGFPAAVSNAHCLVNRFDDPAVFLVVGSRKVGVETIHYPDDPALGVATITRGADANRLSP